MGEKFTIRVAHVDLSRRSFLATAGLAAAGGLLAACSSGGSPATSSAAAPAGSTAKGGASSPAAPAPSSGAAAPSSAAAASHTPGSQPSPFKTKATYNFLNIDAPVPPGGAAAAAGAVVVKMADEWKKLTGDTVDLQYVDLTQYEATQLKAAFASGPGPDLYMISAGDFLEYYNNKAMLDLTPYLSKAALDDFIPGVLSSRIVDNNIYAIAEGTQPVCVYYSVKAFEQAGLSESDIPTSWAQFLDVAHKLTTSSRFGALVETVPGVYQNFTWYPFMWMGGGDVTKGNQSTFDSPPVVNALKFWQDMINQKVAPRKALAGGSSSVSGNLAAGYCAMQVSGIWSVADMKQNAPKFEYGIFRLPVPPGGTYKTIAGGWAWAVNPAGKYADRAAQFVTWALSSNTQSGAALAEQFVAAASDLPTMKSVESVLTQSGAFSTGVLKKFVDDIGSSVQAEPRYPAQVWQAISTAIQNTQLAGKDPKTEAANASATIQKYLDGYHGAPLD